MGEIKGVAANGLTKLKSCYQQQMMIRADILEIPAMFWYPAMYWCPDCPFLLDVFSALPE